MWSPKILAIFDAIPHCEHGGGGITIYSMLRAIRSAGSRIELLSLGLDKVSTLDEARHQAELESHDIPVHRLLVQKSRPRGLVARRIKGFQIAQDVEHAVSKILPDALLLYHWDAIAAASTIENVPKLGLVGDPIHLPNLFRSQFHMRNLNLMSKAKMRARNLWNRHIEIPRLITAMRSLLNGCASSGAFASHHAHELKHMGVAHCEYYRTPVPDPSPFSNSTMFDSRPFRILHIGHLKGIATLSGVEILAHEILPYLSKNLPAGSFEISLVGGFFESMPDSLKKYLNHPAVRVLGQLTNPKEEFEKAHIVLVPTPIELGIRVRILTALSYGKCVVAHRANQAGIPELQNGVNCILGLNGTELAEACLALSQDQSKLRRLAQSGRLTYEQNFSLPTAGLVIKNSLDRLIRGNLNEPIIPNPEPSQRQDQEHLGKFSSIESA